MAEISPLRRRMLEDMTVRNLSPATQQSYIYAVARFSRLAIKNAEGRRRNFDAVPRGSRSGELRRQASLRDLEIWGFRVLGFQP